MGMDSSHFDDAPAFGQDAPTVAQDAAPFVITDAPPPPPKGNIMGRRDLRRIALIAGGVVVALALIGGIALAVQRATNAASPLDVAQAYCQAIKAQNYSKAYGNFAQNVQAQIPQAVYPAAAQAEDAARGNVTACSFGKTTTSQSGTSATLAATVTRAKTGAASYTWQFAQSGSAWKLSQAPDDALVPFATVLRYCNDIQTNQLDAAYQLLSSDEQQSVGQAATFKTDMQGTLQYAGAFGGCHLQAIAPAKDGASATIGLAMDFANFKNTPAQMVVLYPTTTTPAQIDSATVKVVGLDVPFPVPVSELQQLLGAAGGS